MSSAGLDNVYAPALDSLARHVQPRVRPRPTVSIRVVQDTSRVVDLLIMVLTAGFAAHLAHGAVHPLVGAYLVAAATGSLIGSILFAQSDPYRLGVLRDPVRHLRPVLLNIGAAVMVALAAFVLITEGGTTAATWVPIWLVAATFAIGLWRLMLAAVLNHWARHGRLHRKMAIVGANELSRSLIDRVGLDSPTVSIVGVYDDECTPTTANCSGVPVRGGIEELLLQTREQTIDTIVVALPLAERERVRDVCERLRAVASDVCLTTDAVSFSGCIATQGDFDGASVVVVRRRPLRDWQAIQKRALDCTLGVAALVLLSPVLLATAVAIKLDSRGPVLFRQKRLGFNNNIITVFKFRSMFQDMSDPFAARLTERNDPRITRLGHILRKYSLDELPQVFNVLCGDMSLVGPRPHALHAKAANRLYADVVAGYARRHVVKPGITGWAQVRGWRGETNTEEQIEQRVAHDLHYIENWSLWLDLRIIMLTVVREVFSRHAF